MPTLPSYLMVILSANVLESTVLKCKSAFLLAELFQVVFALTSILAAEIELLLSAETKPVHSIAPVSYTHLTLPTSDLV